MCDFCSAKKPKDWDNIIPRREFKNESLTEDFEAIIEGCYLHFDYDAFSCDSSFSEIIEIFFCPMCGRKLS